MVTVEATPRIAENIAVAQTVGALSLSLRSLADNSTELEQAIASGSVKMPDGADPKAEKAMILQLATQPQAGNSTFTTGADVSRFQRRTVPGKGSNGGGGAMSLPTGGMAAAPSLAPGASATTGSFPGDTTPHGPVVRIARGNSVTITSVGGKN